MPTRYDYLVVGLGQTGASCVEFLVQQGAAVAASDTREHPPELGQLQQKFPTLPMQLGALTIEFLQQARVLVVSPGIAIATPAIAHCLQQGIPVIGDIELFCQHARAPIAAITGSNGKSTVTQLVGDMATQAGIAVGVGGNIGVPALTLLTDPAPELYVLELSSFQLETTYSLAAKAAITINISPDHLDRYTSFQDYRAAKLRIYQNCTTAVINHDDPASYPSDLTNPLSFGLAAPADYGFAHGYLMHGNERLLAVTDLRLAGQHNVSNVLAALAMAEALGIPQAAALSAARQFSGLPHRCQLVRTLNGVQWINDSKGTNVGATLAAIEGIGKTLTGKIILIAGGLGKEADFTPLQAAVARHVRSVVLIGVAATQLIDTLSCTTLCYNARTLAAAVSYAKQQAQPGDCVLLSPACASFDQFRGFDHRGEVFMKLVEDLAL